MDSYILIPFQTHLLYIDSRILAIRKQNHFAEVRAEFYRWNLFGAPTYHSMWWIQMRTKSILKAATRNFMARIFFLAHCGVTCDIKTYPYNKIKTPRVLECAGIPSAAMAPQATFFFCAGTILLAFYNFWKIPGFVNYLPCSIPSLCPPSSVNEITLSFRRECPTTRSFILPNEMYNLYVNWSENRWQI